MNALVQKEQNAIATTQAQSAGPLAAAMQALQNGMTMEQIQGLQVFMGMQRDWEADEARKSYVADMAEFKRNPPEIYKTKQVAFAGTVYSHATLGDVSKAVEEPLARHGFSHSWETKQANGIITVTCKITHRLGHSESTTMEAAPDNSGKKNAIQQVASSITYMQRYTLLAACGLATMDLPDDDGHGLSQAPIDYDQRSAVETWIARADAAINVEALRVTRSLAAEEFQAAGDVIGWNAVKVHCANAKAKLEQGEKA
jgi:hypothetical protein